MLSELRVGPVDKSVEPDLFGLGLGEAFTAPAHVFTAGRCWPVASSSFCALWHSACASGTWGLPR